MLYAVNNVSLNNERHSQTRRNTSNQFTHTHTLSLYKSVQSHKRCIAKNEFTAIEAFGLCVCEGGERVQACVCERYIDRREVNEEEA